MLEPLQHLQLGVNHAFIALNVPFEYDLHGDLAIRAVSLADDPVRAGTEGFSELVFASIKDLSDVELDQER
jgi:hypothetical protein